MDIGTIVSWIQLGVWVIGGVLYVCRILRGRTPMPATVNRILSTRILSSNVTLGVVIISGIVLSGFSLYVSHHPPEKVKIVEKVVEKPYRFEWHGHVDFTRVVSKTFESQSVLLDGMSYRYCKFNNVTFIWNGTAPFQFDHNIVTGNYGYYTDNMAILVTAALLAATGSPPLDHIIGPDGVPLDVEKVRKGP